MSYKKGNVDVDIVFDMLVMFYTNPNAHFILISQDGDYFRLVQHLIKHNRLIKIIFPNAKTASRLYRFITNKYWSNLSSKSILPQIGKLRHDPRSTGSGFSIK